MTTNDVALVTGARGGIGRELVARLKARGLRVAAVGRDAAALEPLGADLAIGADVTTPEGAAEAVRRTVEQLGAPRALAHCVGSTLIAPIHRTKAEQWREVSRVNLDSAVWMLGAWIESVRAAPEAARGASAVFVSSVVARIGVANHEAIAAAKGGVEAMVRSAAATYAPLGLRVNAVAPGMTDTPMTAGMLKVSAMRDAAAAQYPLGGVQSAGEVASVIDWLLGEGSGRVTGQVVPVDGGFTAVRPLVKA